MKKTQLQQEAALRRHPIRVAILGRPNVGKSTLFNRLAGRRRALVHDRPGVTRDRVQLGVEWEIGKHQTQRVLLIDTGGMGGETFAEEIQQQVHTAVRGSDVVLFVMDGKEGLADQDRDLLLQLKKAGVIEKRPVVGIVNKVDTESHEERMAEFYAVGLEHLVSTSAEHGRGAEDLKRLVVELGQQAVRTPEGASSESAVTQAWRDASPESTREEGLPRIAIVGRPNVGKSTLLNALLGEDRMIVSPKAGTTVDSVDTRVRLGEHEFILVDTAGIRRKAKTERGIEVLSVVQTKKAIESADVAILVLDAETGLSDQDEKIGGLIEEAGCGVVLLMNKWDVQERGPRPTDKVTRGIPLAFTREDAAERTRKQMAFLSYAPLLFASAKYGKGLRDLGDLLMEVVTQRRTQIGTHEFTEWVRKQAAVHNPRNVRFFMSHQSGRNPPTFVCHVSSPENIHFSLQRHLVNQIRANWGYMGSPVRLVFTK